MMITRFFLLNIKKYNKKSQKVDFLENLKTGVVRFFHITAAMQKESLQSGMSLAWIDCA